MTSPTSSRLHRAVSVASLALLCGLAAACQPPPPAPAPPTPPPPATSRVVVTDVDTFTVSGQPTATRSTDTVLRVMDSAGKTKIGYVSFPVTGADRSATTATLTLTPRQSRFVVQVRTSGAFSNTTTFTNQPALGAVVGQGSTVAGQRLSIPLTGVPVTGGRVHLALTTTSPYELEVLSREGATANGTTDAAPALELTTTTAPPPTTPPSTTPAPPTTTPPTTTPPTTTPTPPTTPLPGWRLTFADEFNGTRVDTTKWLVYDEARGHSVESPKTSTCPLASNVSLAGGKLVMRTQKANGTCSGGQAQSGAGLNTWNTFSQAGGRFEARGRWTQRGNYLWGGFWSHGVAGPGWSKDNPSEIDIWEYIGKTGEPNINRFKPAIHYNYTCEGTCGMQNLPYTGYDVTAWHTYAMEWEPTNPSDPTTMQIRFYLDDVLIVLFDKAGTWRVQPDGTRVLAIAGGWHNPKGPFPNPFGLDRPQQLVLSAWVGAPGVDAYTVANGYRPTGGHADLEIDYVRVYRR